MGIIMMRIGWASQLMFFHFIAASSSGTNLCWSEPFEYQQPQTDEEIKAEQVLRARCEADPTDHESETMLFYLLFKKVNIDIFECHDG